MAVYKLNSKKKGKRDVKKIGGFTLIGISSVVYLFLTGIWPAMFTFLLGVFGIFAYPLFLILFIVGLALVNKRKYVMPKRYIISMALMVYFFLAIIQLIIVGGKGDLSFFAYLGLNYSRTWTAGGILTGIITTPLLYLANSVGAYIILVLAFCLSLGVFLDSLNVFKRKTSQVAVKKEKTINRIQTVEEKTKSADEVVAEKVEKKEEFNPVLNGKIEEEKKEEKKALSTRELLGLDKKRNKAYEYFKDETPKVEKKKEEPKSLRELILTPPEINYEDYFKDLDKAPAKEEVKTNVEILKQEEMNLSEEPPKIEEVHTEEVHAEVRPDEFQNTNNPFVHSDADIVREADDIIRNAVEEEKAENPEIYENAIDTNESFVERENKINERMSDRSFERPTFENIRRDNNFAPEFPERNERDNIFTRNQPEEKEEEVEEPEEPYVYERPPLEYITTKSVDLSTLNDDVAEKRVLLENSLENFGIPAKVQGVVVGPAVTRYELEMPQGVSVSKIKNRADDIALSLAAEGAIRIEAPVPGKSVVGVEVPNKSIATVSLRDVLESKEFRGSPSPLTFALGKDITGNTITCNMQKLTHLLVAGSTGSGKSVCLNSIILSIIYKASPDDVKIVLVDPKRVEFTSYNGLPHLIMPNVVCETQKAINTLAWAVTEMERRFEVLGFARVKNIDEYNQTPDVVSGKVKKMPFIVIIVDELADLMMTGKKEVEEKIIRLAQKSRAAGIHLILATQRPSVDVITGLIKSNFPSRIAFAVTSAVDSMTILDRVGAEKLLGKGDMLYYPVGAQEPKRVQACFITTGETNRIVDYVRENNKPIFDKEIEEQINNPNKNNNNGGVQVNNEMDELLPLALKSAIDCGQASATMIRRKFAIGYPRAARIIDQMEEAGYISTADGVKGRTVYITLDEFHDIFGDQYD